MSLESIETLRSRKLNEPPVLLPTEVQDSSDSSVIIIVLSVLVALFFITIIALIMAILLYFVPRMRKSIVKNQSACTVADTIQDTGFTLKETNALSTVVKEGAYEDVSTDHNVTLAHTGVQNTAPLYVDVGDSNNPSDGYIVAQNVKKDDTSHVYTQLELNNF